MATIFLGAQGTVRGTLTDATNGETVPFANVLIVETQTGNTTDLDGTYAISLDAGIYSIEYSFLGFATTTVSDIEVKDGEVTIIDVVLEEESTLIEEVVITAKQIRNTETAVLTIQRKAIGLLDGVSTQAIKRAGDSDVGAAVKRVTGVSVEDGKHVIVRGLGDRYSKTQLNGLDVPGLDPDRNSVQLDIFPTNLVDNIIVYKSFTPDLPGDFTGGMVDIVTKDFPQRKILSLSASMSYNPDMHLNSGYITSEGGSTDMWGFDDGTRKLPQAIRSYNAAGKELPNIVQGTQELESLTGVFKNNMATIRQRSAIDQNYSASFGNQVNLKGLDIGYTLSGNYKNEMQYYENVEFNTFFKDQLDKSNNELFQDIENRGDLGNHNVQWSALAGGALKTDRSKLSLSVLHSQNGTSKAAFIRTENFEFNPSILQRDVIEYTERSVSNILVSGKHTLGSDGNLDINWKLSPTFSRMNEPDIRQVSYETTNGEFEINRSVGANVTRTYRSLQEDNYAGKVDLTYQFEAKDGLKSKIKAGFAGVYKERDFGILNYLFPIHNRGSVLITGHPNQLFSESFRWTPDSDRGIYIQGNIEPSNTYNARQQVLGAYAMHEYPLTSTFKVIYGARVEKVDQYYTGRKQIIRNPETDAFNDDKVLDELNILPSVSLIYNVLDNRSEGETINLRGSFSQTLARPSFKEKSIAQIEDRIGGRTFIGNILLEQTSVTNFDLRWEYFMPSGQIFSASTFHKSFDKPIELTAFDATSPTTFTPRNVGNAKLTGIELEMRKNLVFLSPELSPFSVSVNATIVKSSVEMSDEEIEGRSIALRDGETMGTTRDMVGQSPYLINAGLSYLPVDRGIEATASYNVQGKRLAIVGIGQVPDVFEEPFHSLNFKISKEFGNENQWKVSASASNILNDQHSKIYESHSAQNQLFELLNPGRSFGISLGYTM